MAPKTLTELRESLVKSPNDYSLREQLAKRLEQSGEGKASIELLLEKFVNLCEHEQYNQHCLCKNCFQLEKDSMLVGQQEFIRDYVICQGRVLFYWLPVELLGDKLRVRHSVKASLFQRLQGVRRNNKPSSPFGEGGV